MDLTRIATRIAESKASINEWIDIRRPGYDLTRSNYFGNILTIFRKLVGDKDADRLVELFKKMDEKNKSDNEERTKPWLSEEETNEYKKLIKSVKGLLSIVVPFSEKLYKITTDGGRDSWEKAFEKFNDNDERKDRMTKDMKLNEKEKKILDTINNDEKAFKSTMIVGKEKEAIEDTIHYWKI